MTQKTGAELKVGDTIETWWAPNRDMIVSLKPYDGPLGYLFPAGARIAVFALNEVGMTIDNSDLYEVITPNLGEPT